MKRKWIFLYVIIMIACSLPIMNHFLIRGHDIYFHLMRIEGLAEGLRCGQFPVRIQPVWYGDFGYAVSVFYGDLFVYFAAILRLLGFSLQNAYKGYLLLCNAATVCIAGYSFGKIFKNAYVGVFGSALYSLAVYRLVNLYTRGALGEYTGMAFLPLILYACTLLLDKERKKENLKKGSFLLGIGMAFILQSHILTAELTVLMLCGVVLLFAKRVFRKEVLLNGLRAVLIAVGLSLWFLVPFGDYMLNGSYQINAAEGEEPLIQRVGIFFSQIFPLFDNAVGESLDLSAGPQGDFAQGVGLGLFLALPAIVILTAFLNKKLYQESEWRIAIAAALFGGAAVCCSTIYFPWDFLCRISSVLNYVIVNIQFPWRFTGIAAVCLTLLWCALVVLIGRHMGRNQALAASITVVLLMSLSAGHYVIDLLERGQRIQVRTQADMDSYVASGEEYLPLGTEPEELMPESLLQEEGLEITQYQKNGTNVQFDCRNHTDETKILELPLLYYDGYEAYGVSETGKKSDINVTAGNNNAVRLLIEPDMEASVFVSFREPWYWRLSEIISLVSVLLLASAARNSSNSSAQRFALAANLVRKRSG